MANLPPFSSSAALQDFILREARPGTLVIVPHRRLAHQLWHRQRTAAMAAGRAAWEPLPLVTLQGWWADLFNALWPPHALAPPLVRLALWLRAMKDAPAPGGATPDREWAQALDDTHILLTRHLLPTTAPMAADSPLTAWRRQVTRIFTELLAEGGWISPGDLPAYLSTALNAGKIKLPPQILLVGLESPAPAEDEWLKAVARHTRVVPLQVKGDLAAVQEAVVLPDRSQEMEWVAARLLEPAHSNGLPWHRLAVTSPDMDTYAPHLQRVLGELLGPAQTDSGWAYNLSQGPRLADTPLFRAAVLPLAFIAAGERREDLVTLLLSPFYGLFQAHQGELALWDRIFREQRREQGWDHLARAVIQEQGPDAAGGIPARLAQVWDMLRAGAASAPEWGRRLQAAWKELVFPQGLDEAEMGPWGRITALLQELGTAFGSETLNRGEFLDWLTHGARRQLLPGPGIQEAGIQVLGLLEMRGLDFDRVFCLGMNAGSFPPPPRSLPLLSPAERGAVLGGTYPSQHRFARELFDTLLGTAAHIVLTRPRLVEQEERVATPLYEDEWQRREMAVLSAPNRSWLRAPAVQAAFSAAPGASLTGYTGYGDGPFALTLPEQLSLSQITTALMCPCRFLWEILLRTRALPEIEAGLDPRERGDRLHQVLARFTGEFRKNPDYQRNEWNRRQAREQLILAARQILATLLADVHWQAEWDRWLGEEGLLWEWLGKEDEHFHQGWRWHGIEVFFGDLRGAAWPFSLKGRIDRLDYHPENGDLVIWDYKSGEVPSHKKVFVEGEEYQLPCYLLAVRQGRVETPAGVSALQAGFIGLKSPRQKHLKYENFGSGEAEWQPVLAAFEERVAAAGRRLAAGDFTPHPTPAPVGRKKGACQYCSYSLICGFTSGPLLGDGEDEA